MKSHDRSWAILLIVVFIGLLMWFLNKQNLNDLGESPTEEAVVDNNFELGSDVSSILLVCNLNKRIGANFKENGVLLNLSDERSLVIPKVSENKYVLRDKIVFNVGTESANLEENGEVTYENCKSVQAETD